MNKKRLLVLSSPSGGGKSTIARHLMKQYKNIVFSISATTRKSRPKETYGIEYYFLTKDDFLQKLKNNEFVEYEEIFGNYYGTYKTEILKAFDIGDNILFDIDVRGALSLKKAFPDDALMIFISPISKEVLFERLRGRSTESEEEIQRRVDRADEEMKFTDEFDYVIVNDQLQTTIDKIITIIEAEMYLDK